MKIARRLRACAAGVTLALAVVAAAPMSPAPVVHTTDGDVGGISGFDTQQFLGIPFAQPPIGALRFAAPAPVIP